MLKVGVTQGDPNGVGPEVIIKALAPEGMTELMTPVIFGNKGVFLAAMQRLKGENFHFQSVSSAANAKAGKVNLVNVGEGQVSVTYGQPSAEGGLSAYQALEAAVAALKAGDIDVLVTAPINKSAIQSDEFAFPGHTEYLEARFAATEVDDDAPASEEEVVVDEEDEAAAVVAVDATAVGDVAGDAADITPKRTSVNKAQMILFNDDLRVALLTTHLPISEVSSHISEENLTVALENFDRTLRRDFACDRPRIAVLSLNPHAGDNGLLGSEEVEVMIPTLRKLQERGLLVFGPYAADGFFGSGEWRKFDGVLAMYHDQGLAPFKTIAGQSGVNFTSGLDYIRTSPDHGTAYDIAGEMIADPSSMREAIYKAIDIYAARERYDEMSAHPLHIKSKS